MLKPKTICLKTPVPTLSPKWQTRGLQPWHKVCFWGPTIDLIALIIALLAPFFLTVLYGAVKKQRSKKNE